MNSVKKKAKTLKKKNLNSEKKTAPLLKIGKDIWPLERDVLFRPDRFKYVRKLVKSEGCVFCNSGKGKANIDSLCVYKSKYSLIVINKFPYNSGHVLVMPKRHCGDLLDLSDDEFYDLQNTIRLAMKAAKEIYNPGGFNLGMNHGAVAGAGIPEHLHYHLIPRWSGDLNFFPLIAETKVVIESLEITFDRYLRYFNSYEL
jgi:ATP adenylyltransferase